MLDEKLFNKIEFFFLSSQVFSREKNVNHRGDECNLKHPKPFFIKGKKLDAKYLKNVY